MGIRKKGGGDYSEIITDNDDMRAFACDLPVNFIFYLNHSTCLWCWKHYDIITLLSAGKF
jgi:hypothetical protein